MSAGSLYFYSVALAFYSDSMLLMWSVVRLGGLVEDSLSLLSVSLFGGRVVLVVSSLDLSLIVVCCI